MSISDERLAHLLVHPSHINPRYELPGIVTELQALRAAAKVRAIRGDGPTHCHREGGCIRAADDETCGNEGQCSILIDIYTYQDAAIREALAATPAATGGEKE